MWAKSQAHQNMALAYPMIVDPNPYHNLVTSCPMSSPISNLIAPGVPHPQMHSSVHDMQPLHHSTVVSPLSSPMGCQGVGWSNGYNLPPSWGSYDSLIHVGIPVGLNPQDLQGWPLTPALHDFGKEEAPNHIILVTILNPAYPITVDVLHTICQPYGNVQRVVIFKKNGLQAMVEFENIENATRARDGLQGADIYSGCCTLRIQFAKPSKLNVFRNDNDSWDYTSSLGDKHTSSSPRAPLLQEPRGYAVSHPPMRGVGGPIGLNNGTSRGYMSGGYHGGGGGHHGSYHSGHAPPLAERYGPSSGGGGMRGGGPGLAGASPLGGPPIYGMHIAAPPSTSHGGPMTMMGPEGGPGGPHQGAVLMVYGLHKEKMNSDRLFNLLCLYGNVVRVKFLKTKEGCAMVQMGDGSAVERSIEKLNNSTFFENKMQLSFSKQAFLADVHQPYTLADGSPSFKDYMGNKNNRFINPEMASKNRIQPPSKILHFFNTPPNIDEETITQIFADKEVALPKTVKIFPSKTERSSSGLLEFNDVSEAIEGLVAANHCTIQNPNSKFPYVTKLCFSSSRYIQNPPNKLIKDDNEKVTEI